MLVSLRNIVLLSVLLIVGCDDESGSSNQAESAAIKAVEFSIQTNNALIKSTLPAIRHALPGLNTYATQFKNIHVEDNYWASIVFNIPDNADIPHEYAVQGHNCFIEINKDGSAIKVPKSPCKSALLDREEKTLDSDYWFYLDPDYLTYEPYDFSSLPAKKRIELTSEYLKKVEDSVNLVVQKKSWLPYDLPNFSRLFSQMNHNGLRFSHDGAAMSPYDSCRQVGMSAETWWQNQVFSINDIASNDPAKIEPALSRIQESYKIYQSKVSLCKKEIKISA